jgi:hypothetical protein
MTDANRTPQLSVTGSTGGLSLPAQFLVLAKQIEAGENVEGTVGGVTVTYNPNGTDARITATIPLERIAQPDGTEILKPVNFLK